MSGRRFALAIVAVVAAATAPPASAIYRCDSAGAAPTFQDAPCPATAKAEQLDLETAREAKVREAEAEALRKKALREAAAEDYRRRSDERAATIRSSRGIGVSRAAIMRVMPASMTTEPVPKAIGKNRILGKTPDNMVLLTTDGDDSGVDSASLVLGLPKDLPDVMTRNTELMLAFVRETTPAWPMATDWAVSAVTKLAAGGPDKLSTERSGRRLTVQVVRALGILMVTVE